MMRFKKGCMCLGFIFALTLNNGFAAVSHPVFEHITYKDGLSQSFVKCITQTKQGYMVFGTSGGLNIYDGYSFKIYQEEEGNPRSLSGNRITALLNDSQGNLWVGSDLGGLDRYNPEREEFIQFPYPEILGQRKIQVLFEDRQHRIWIGTGQGLFLYDHNAGSVIPFTLPDGGMKLFEHDSIMSLAQDPSGHLWVGTWEQGLALLNPETGDCHTFLHVPNDSSSLSDNIIWSLFLDYNGDLWVGTNKGLCRKHPDRNAFEPFLPYENSSHTASNNRVLDVMRDRDHRLWVATDGGGVSFFDEATGHFIIYRHNESNPNSLSHDRASKIFQDDSGLLWIGSLGGGINKADLRSWNNFKQHDHHAGEPNSLGNNYVKAILEAADGMLWVGTYEGLNRYDSETGRYSHYHSGRQSGKSLSADQVLSLAEDENRRIWIGTWGGGLNVLDPDTGLIRHFSADIGNPLTLNDNYIRTIEFNSMNHTLWIGTDRGVALFHPGNDTFQRLYFPSKEDVNNKYRVQCLLSEQDGTLWIGTFGGLFRVSIPDIRKWPSWPEDFEAFYPDRNRSDSISHSNVYCFAKQDEDTLWVGTFQGLNKMNTKTGSFQVFNKKDGFSDDVIYGILFDEQNNLWLSTNKGLSCFNPTTKTIQNYNSLDGLQSDEFNRGAYEKGRDGQLYFGGIQGLNFFQPSELKTNEHIPPIELTDFALFHNSVPLQGPESVLSRSISFTPSISLTHQDYIFSFSFSALDFTQPKKNQYRYMLKGFDPDWIKVNSNQRTATYTNLSPGEYTFMVTGSNNDGLWNPQPRTIRVSISPPWWKTSLAYILYIMIIMSILGSLYSWKVSNLKKYKDELEIAVQKRTIDLKGAYGALNDSYSALEEKSQALEKSAQEAIELRLSAEKANEAKSVFVANMSHEIRTPLNAIIGFSELALRSTLSSKTRTYFSRIKMSSHSLLRIINSILDFSKIESGKIEIEKEHFNLLQILGQLGDLFGNTASKKNLEFLIELDPSIPCALIGDSLHLSQVLTNLITNAVKFTHSGEVIVRISSLSQSNEKVKLRFSVIDTGVGVDPEALQSLFDSFTQADSSIKRTYGGTGLGLTISKRLVELMGGHIQVKSRPDKGSCFCFTLDLDRQPEEHEISFLFSSNMETPRIMVVEDHTPTRDYLMKLMEFLGLDAKSVQTGSEAYRILSGEHDFGLVILDHSIPGEDWFDIAQKINRAQGMRPPLQKIIMFNSLGSEDEMNVQQLESGRGILIKPILLDSFFKSIREVLDRSCLSGGFNGSPGVACPQCNIHGARILLVEDNSINQEVSREFLQKEGAIVVIANTGLEALELVHKHEFDLVLMDLQMPGMDGYETTRKIRETYDHDTLPIVAVTAHVMKGAKKQCMEAGMDDFLGKPVAIEHFFSVLNRWVGNKGTTSLEPNRNVTKNSSRWVDLPMDLPGIELKSVLARLRGNSDLLSKLLEEFSESKSDAVKDIRKAMRNGDSETALKMLHNLKGLSGNISALGVYRMTEAIDSAIREGRGDRLPDFLENLEAAMETVFESSSYLNKLEDPGKDSQAGFLDEFDPETMRQSMYQLGSMLKKSNISALDKIENMQMVMPLEIEKLMHELNKYIHNLDFGAAMDPFNEIIRILEERIGDESVEP